MIGLKDVFRHYLKHALKHKASFFVVLLFYFISSVLISVFTPLIYKYIIDALSGGKSIEFAYQQAEAAVILLGIVLLVYFIFSRTADYMYNFFESKIIKELQQEAFSTLIKHSVAFFERNFTGSLIAKFNRYIRSFEVMLDILVYQFYKHFIVAASVLIVLFAHSFELGVSVLVWLAVYFIVVWWFIKKRVEKDVQNAQAQSRTTGVLSDILSNILNVKIFGKDTKEISIFSKVVQDEAEKRISAWTFFSHQNTFMSAYVLGFEFLIMFLSVKLWYKGAISIGTILLVQIYVFRLFDIVWQLGRQIASFTNALANAKEMIEILNQHPEIKDPKKPVPCKISQGDIKVENITFCYENKPVFKNFSMHIRPKQKVALVGKSGSGKSTIVKLIMRFADPQEGRILIDGIDIKSCKQSQLRRKISFVPQEPILFHRSIKENIAYGKPSASFKEIQQAAKLAYADEFIKELPQGYDTLVGERGVKLSGGQRQRIALARVFLEDAPILILDEATSALDSESEELIQKALKRLMKNKTVIVIAHRLSTIKNMEKILVFEKGKIIEEGNHSELIKRGGRYAKFWKLQSKDLLD